VIVIPSFLLLKSATASCNVDALPISPSIISVLGSSGTIVAVSFSHADVFVPVSISPQPINSKDDTVPTSNNAIVLKVFIRNPLARHRNIILFPTGKKTSTAATTSHCIT